MKDQSLKVLIFSLRDHQGFYVQILKELSVRFNVKVILAIPNSSYLTAYEGIITKRDKVIYMDSILNPEKNNKYGSKNIYETASAYEEKYNISFFQDLVQLDRNVATYYLSYAPRHPYAKLKPDLEYENYIKTLCDEFEFFENLFKKEKIDLVIKRPDKGCMPVHYICKENFVPFTYPVKSRYKSLVMWSFGAFNSSLQLEKKWNRTKNFIPSNINKLETPGYAKGNDVYFRRICSIKNLLKDVLLRSVERLDFVINDLKKGVLFKKKSRQPYIATIKYSYTKWSESNTLRKLLNRKKNILKSKPYLLYLSQLEPELGTNFLAKEFNNSLAIIKQLSVCLPSKYNLMVKEHTLSIGSRGANYYQELFKLPNLIFADPSVSSRELLVNSLGVATVTGTIPIEAACIGKPAFVFSKHNEYDFLPSVILEKNLMDLHKTLRNNLFKLTKEQSKIYKEAGWRYIEALKSLSFEGQDTVFDAGNSSFTDIAIKDSVDLLILNMKEQKKLLLEKEEI